MARFGGIIYIFAVLLKWPQPCMEAVREGLKLWADLLVPALFPFFVLSSLSVELGLSAWLGRLLQPVMAPLFRVSGACAGALALGLVGGYPVGARTAAAVYQRGECSKTEAERLLAFCNNSGPAFILGAVGSGVFHSGRAGLLLYLTHVTAALIVGVLFRFYGRDRGTEEKTAGCSIRAAAFAPALIGSLRGALASAMNICAFVVFFAVLLRALELTGFLRRAAGILELLLAPLGICRGDGRTLITGLLELSSGVTALDGRSAEALPMAAFLLGWGGLSVHCQAMSCIEESGLPMGTYWAGKLLHGILAALLTAGFLSLPLPLRTQPCLSVWILGGSERSDPLTRAFLYACGTWLLFLAAGILIIKNSSRKKRGTGL